MRKAFTLIEVLIAIAVMMVIAAIIAPVIVRSKESARGTNDISNMRQLGLAAAMYAEQNGEPPTGCPVIVSSRLAPESLCSGMIDPYKEGLGNRLVRALAQRSKAYEGLDVPYKLTFVGWREFALPKEITEDVMQRDMSVGWLVDLAPSENIPEEEPYPPAALTGRYRRLLLDGSVQWRAHGLLNLRPGGPKGWAPIMLFADVDEQWLISQNVQLP
jgi:prepilin-type N-terminal cleavage/methylation domain-containing protein